MVETLCPKCKAPLRAGAKFCSKCGASLSVQPISSERAPGKEPAPIPQEPSTRTKTGINPLKSAVTGFVGNKLMTSATFVQWSKVPLSRRPEAWWDVLSMLGGAASGYLWFLYSSVRGLSLDRTLTGYVLRVLPGPLAQSATSLFNLLPALIVLALPLIIFVARRKLMQRLQALTTRFQAASPKSRLVYVLLGASAAWLAVYHKFFIFQQREGLDYITPVLMTAIPTGIVCFRSQIDRLLAPFQAVQQKIPQGLLFGIGLGIPFLTAHLLYNVGHFVMYPLMRTNVVVGTLLSYMLVRRVQSAPAAGQELSGTLRMLPYIVFFTIGFAVDGHADDFLTDPFNLNDGLRTPGWGTILAGIPTAVVTMLVNGQQVAQTILRGLDAAPEGEDAEHKNFIVVVETRDVDGLSSTKITDDPLKPLFLLAHCEEEGRAFPSGDPTITLSTTLNADWVSAREESATGGRRWRLQVPTPLPLTPQPETVGLTVSAGQSLISAPVTLEVVVYPRMVVEAKEWQKAEEFVLAYEVFGNDETEEIDTPVFDDLKIYWVKPNDPTKIPVKPDFQPETWKITANPDYLDFDTPVPDESGIIWTTDVRLKPGVVFDDDWLASNGVIEVRVEMHATLSE